MRQPRSGGESFYRLVEFRGFPGAQRAGVEGLEQQPGRHPGIEQIEQADAKRRTQGERLAPQEIPHSGQKTGKGDNQDG
jgi:hypothetical protein